MKTKTIPFDLETAKKIQAGEIKGKMFASDTHNKIRIICFDRKAAFPKIVALEEDKIGVEWIRECNELGQFMAPWGASAKESDETISKCIVLEVPDDKPQFKPFDRVLVRNSDKGEWRPRLYSRKGNIGYCTQDGCEYMQILPYEGNEHLLGTTNKPKED